MRLRASDVVGSLLSGCDVFASLKVEGYRRMADGSPEFRCGGNAVVFTVDADGGQTMLKCLLGSGLYRREIYDYIAATGPGVLSPARLLVDEMCVWNASGEPCRADVVVAPWVEGRTLGEAVRDAVLRGDRGALAALAARFVHMACETVAAPWAHGDLKPDNIVVTPGGNMVLVDYDAMFVPPLAGRPAAELGTPGWQHPARSAEYFDSRIDDYSIAMLCVTLCALSADETLWREAMRTDLRLIDAEKAVDGRCPALEHIRRIFGAAGFDAGAGLCDALASPEPLLPDLPALLDGCRAVMCGH